MDKERRIIEISSASIFRIIFIILVLVFLYIIRDVLAILFLSIIIASAVGHLSGWLDKRGYPYKLGVITIYLGGFFLFVFLIYLMVPSLVNEVKQISSSVPTYLEKFSLNLKAFENFASRYYDIGGGIQNLLNYLGEQLGNLASNIFGTIANIFGGAISAMAILVISIYLSFQEKGIRRFLRSIVPDEHEEYIVNLWERVQRKLGRWLQGQIILGLIVGILVYLGLSILGVPYALFLAIIAGVLELIPIAGPLIALIPAALLAFMQSPLLGFLTVFLYGAIQQVENHILVPRVIQKVVGLNPVIVILALLVGANLAGVLGVILSVPITVIVVEIFRDIVGSRKKHEML